MKKTGFVFGAGFVLYIVAVVTCRWWLPWFAEFLIVGEPLANPDVVIVSTGSYARFVHAVNTVKNSGAFLLLVGDERLFMDDGRTRILDLARQEAVDSGVPAEKILSDHSTSTDDDARVARRVMLARGFRSGLVISDPYNMRRLVIVFKSAFRGTDLKLGFSYPEPAGGSAVARWWEDMDSFVYVIKEWVKLPINLYQAGRNA